jgi:hypothetical protein
MSRLGSIAVRLIVIFGLTALIGVTTYGVMLSHAHARVEVGFVALGTAGAVSVAFWTAMRDIDRGLR